MLENLKLVRDFFPLVLLKGHLKYNFFGLLYWALLLPSSLNHSALILEFHFCFFRPSTLVKSAYGLFYYWVSLWVDLQWDSMYTAIQN